MNKCTKCGHAVGALICSNSSYCRRRVQAQRQDREEAKVMNIQRLVSVCCGAGPVSEISDGTGRCFQCKENAMFELDTWTQTAEQHEMLKSIHENLGVPFVFEADLEAQEMGFANDEVRKINEELGFIESRKGKT